MKLKIGLVFLTLFCIYTNGITNTVTVQAGDNNALIEAIEIANNSTGPTRIVVIPGPNNETVFTFTQAYMGTDNALPVITSDIVIFPGNGINTKITLKRDPTAANFRLAEVVETRFELGQLNVESFNVNGNGGALLASGRSSLYCVGTDFRDNFATGEGGAIYVTGDTVLFATESGRTSIEGPGRYIRNSAGSLGGAISVQGNAAAIIGGSVFEDNNAGVFGCDININSTGNARYDYALILRSNTFTANCPNVLFENPNGRMMMRNNTFTGMGNAIDSTDTVNLFGNLFDMTPSNNKQVLNSKFNAVCNDFGTNAISSLGYNISNESSCNLNQSTDLTNTDPLTNIDSADQLVSLQAESPAIDSGPITQLENTEGFDFLPCDYKDSRGLGRPQDANLDGVFECDRGSYEVQGGLNLTNAQSGLFYDVDRSGEGIVLEMLSATSALVTMFTYNPNKSDLMWFIGVGNVIGNSVVIDEMQTTSGGVFGTAFNPNNIVTTTIGGMSLIFPDCNATSSPGRLTFQTGFEFQNEIENLLVKNNRLTRLLNCDQSQPNLMTGRSGSFYDTSRSGEGVFVQYLDSGSAFVIFYTYTPDGKQFWFLSSDVEINGDTLTANMIYPASTTGFGSQFNPSELDFQSWGTVILEYQAGCNNVNVSYNSTVEGYGSGSYSYTRLTQPAGTTCDL
jgi:predicted outer membrane repeat protein